MERRQRRPGPLLRRPAHPLRQQLRPGRVPRGGVGVARWSRPLPITNSIAGLVGIVARWSEPNPIK